MSETVTVYVELLDGSFEGAVRKVQATPEGGAYRIEGPMPAGEEWKFPPGTLVRCEVQRIFESIGEVHMPVAVARID